jgi:putative FmdB family regulatory protein
MPTYEYVCPPCGHEFEKFQSMNDEPVKVCPACRKRQVKRKIGMGAGLIFKGSGFYETDYKQAGRKKETESSEAKSESKSEGASSSKPKESAEKKKPSSDSGASGSRKADS